MRFCWLSKVRVAITCASSWWLTMRSDGRRPRARVEGVIAGAFESSRIMASIFRTPSLCCDSSGSLIVGIALSPRFLSSSHEPLGLHVKAGQRPRRDGLDGATDPEIAVDRRRDPIGEVGSTTCLHRAAQLVHLAHRHDLHAILLDLRKAADDRVDRAREHIHAADREHVVHAPGDPAGELEQRAPAEAPTADSANAVAGAITEHRHTPSSEVGHDELALAFVLRLASLGIEDLRDEIRLIDMHAVASLARKPVRADLGRPGVVERCHAELSLYALARGRDRRPGLAGVYRYAQG